MSGVPGMVRIELAGLPALYDLDPKTQVLSGLLRREFRGLCKNLPKR